MDTMIAISAQSVNSSDFHKKSRALEYQYHVVGIYMISIYRLCLINIYLSTK